MSTHAAAVTDRITSTLLTAKSTHSLTFASLAQLLKRDEVAVAGIFYGAVHPSPEDIDILSEALRLDATQLRAQFAERGYPSRGVGVEMPPKDPLIYRLYEIVQTYGWSYKAVLNEIFGDGIVSAIAFSTKVEKEVDEEGTAWAVITMRGKWLPFKRF